MLSRAEPMRDRNAPNADEERTVDAGTEYTIDDLASVSQVPSRTIRFYQSKGVLPKPIIRGRVAFYGKPHLERLELIASLQDRGLRIEAIRELVARIDKGEVDIGEWLGLDAQLQQPWANDQPRSVTEDELYELAGRKRVGLLNDLVRGKLVERRGNVFFVPSPALLAITTRLESAGIDIEDVVRAKAILEKNIGRAAKDLTELMVSRVGKEGADVDHAKAIEELRPLAMEGVRVIFAQAMQAELRELAHSGRSAKVARRRTKS
ncbi:MAG: putative transcription regulator protein [Labilithrix sp.]|nr:putative transcription regulator protein [Labilithrix sp.]